ncbi:MAG TPA: cytochrome c peroxidase [Kofleriaceae bacterium]|nr:cytochrome c peroxidase [Kofleriaceae bacterium]
MNRLGLLAIALALAACPRGSKSKPHEPVGSGAAPATGDAGPAVALPPAPPLPAVPAGLPPLPANPRVTPEAVAFGELLFNDTRLSPDEKHACAFCHDPAHGFSGGQANAADGKPNLRRTPPLVNLAWVKEYGWDGRFTSFDDFLASHVKGQIGDMLDPITERITAIPTYAAHAARVGGTPRDAIVQSLEAYALTRYEGDAPWDRLERTALSRPGQTPNDPVLAGYQLFTGKAQCAQCHTPPLYTDGGYHQIEKNQYNDAARGRVEGHLQGSFKTPTLRGAASRSDFFHTASKQSLEDVVAFYAASGAAKTPDPPDQDPLVRKIKLTADEQKSLIAFLKALTSDRPAPTAPVLP